MTDDDDPKRRSQRLAKELLESLQDAVTSPERAAFVHALLTPDLQTIPASPPVMKTVPHEPLA